MPRADCKCWLLDKGHWGPEAGRCSLGIRGDKEPHTRLASCELCEHKCVWLAVPTPSPAGSPGAWECQEQHRSQSHPEPGGLEEGQLRKGIWARRCQEWEVVPYLIPYPGGKGE